VQKEETQVKEGEAGEAEAGRAEAREALAEDEAGEQAAEAEENADEEDVQAAEEVAAGEVQPEEEAAQAEEETPNTPAGGAEWGEDAFTPPSNMVRLLLPKRSPHALLHVPCQLHAATLLLARGAQSHHAAGFAAAHPPFLPALLLLQSLGAGAAEGGVWEEESPPFAYPYPYLLRHAGPATVAEYIRTRNAAFGMPRSEFGLRNRLQSPEVPPQLPLGNLENALAEMVSPSPSTSGAASQVSVPGSQRC
jgi:hypothetical protein